MSYIIRDIGSTIYFHFASNDTAGSGDDGASPTCVVRECGASASVEPITSFIPYLLSHASYPDGCYEVEVEASPPNGFAAGKSYAVFCSLAVDGENPTGLVGQFSLVETGQAPVSNDAIAAVVDTKLTTEHGSGSWTTGTAPTVEEIDNYLTTKHGAGDWTAPTEAEIDNYLTTQHGSGAWTTGTAPTVADIDNYLSSQHGSGNWACGAGTGVNPVTITVKDDAGSPAANVLVVVRDSSENPPILAVDRTDSAGQVEMQLDDGSYKVRLGSGMVAWCATGAKYSYDNPYDLTVSGTTSVTYTCSTETLVDGGLTFSEMQGMLNLMIEAKWGERGVQRFPEKLIKQLLNDAHQYLCNELEWYRGKEEISITASTNEYCVSCTRRRWLAVTYTDDSADTDYVLEEASLQAWLLVLQEGGTSENLPELYCRYGNKIMLWPVPDDSNDTLTIYYVADVPVLTNDDDKPTYPGHLHEQVVNLAYGQAHNMMGDVETGVALQAQVSAVLERQRLKPTVSRSTGRIHNRSTI